MAKEDFRDKDLPAQQDNAVSSATDDEPGEVGDLYSEGAEMGFLDHLEELRFVILRTLLVFIVGIVLVAIFIRPVESFLSFPITRAFAEFEVPQERLITNKTFGVFNVLIQIAFLGALSLALPAALYFIGRFVAPALRKHEVQVLLPGSIAAFLLFLLGCAFTYYLVLPAALSVSIRINNFFGYDMLWTATDYYGMVFGLMLMLGGAFQFPLVIVLLAYIGAITTEQLKLWRRMAFAVILVVSALITPGGDPITLFILCGPLYALYEAAILVSGFFERARNRRLAKEEA